MKYLCLGYFDRAKMDGLTEAELEAVMGQCGPHLRELYQSGQVIIDAGLDTAAKRLQRVNGKVTVTDGPFAEVKEMIGSAILIEAESMADAVRIASLHPTTRVEAGEQLGWRLEIRPIHYFKERA